MASNRLVKLPNFSYSSLDYDTIINDIKTLIRENPEYLDNWDDFLESNAGKMLIETMAYIIEKGSSRIDWISREKFISTATQRQSIIDLLRLINYRPTLPRAAKLLVRGRLTKWRSSFPLPNREQIYGLDNKGTATIFECIENLDDGKPDYDFVYTMNTGDSVNQIVDIENIPFYQGRTVEETEIYMTGTDKESILLSSYPVIENSVRVFSLTTGKESTQVESFISPDAQQNDVLEANKVPPYIIEIDELNRVKILFGISTLVKTPMKGERFQVLYRIGGGIDTNIVAGALNLSKTYTIGDDRTTVIFTNLLPGSAGADQESIDDAKLTAPISLRSANKTVTCEDYIVHLETDPSILKAAVIGKTNEPADIYTEYGYSLPPLDAWIYVVPKRTNWETFDPQTYNKYLSIGRPYDKHGFIDYEDIAFTTTIQTAFLSKYRKYKGRLLYITLVSDLTTQSYVEDDDYTIDSTSCTITRISTADGGTIPSGEQNLRVKYIIEDDLLVHYQSCMKNFTFISNEFVILLSNISDDIYPQTDIVLTNKTATMTYEEDRDYSIDWTSNKIKLVLNSRITNTSEKYIVSYSNNWKKAELDVSEESNILNIIKNKKMICVDNYVKDTIYSTFDVAATIYCYKNMRKTVLRDLESYIRSLYTLDKMQHSSPILKVELTMNIMNFDGVRFIEISYLGKNYHAYKKMIMGELTLAQLIEMNSNTVDSKIEAKYNEIVTLANDEYTDNVQILSNKIKGLIFEYKDA